jgi:hypothetical protein
MNGTQQPVKKQRYTLWKAPFCGDEMDSPTLTAEERHQLLAVLRELDQKSPTEQRRGPRRKVQLNLEIRLLGEKRLGRMPAILVNVAARGVGLQVERPMKVGQKFLLPLRFVEGGGWLVLCEVRNYLPLRVAHKVGAKFLDRIDDPDGTSKPPMDWLM